MFSVVKVVARISLTFFFLYQIPCSFQFLVVQVIVFDLEAIWDTLLPTKLLYSPLSFNRCITVVLSDHAYVFLIFSLLRQILTFSARLADIYAATNSRRCIDNFFLANLDLLVIKFSLNIFC